MTHYLRGNFFIYIPIRLLHVLATCLDDDAACILFYEHASEVIGKSISDAIGCWHSAVFPRFYPLVKAFFSHSFLKKTLRNPNIFKIAK